MAVDPRVDDCETAAGATDARCCIRFALALQRRPILAWHHGEEVASRPFPLIEQTLRAGAAGITRVLLDEVTQGVALPEIGDGNQIDHCLVTLLPEQIELVEYECHSTAHAGGKVSAGLAEHDDGAAGHVFAAVIADSFDDGDRAAVAHSESLTRS